MRDWLCRIGWHKWRAINSCFIAAYPFLYGSHCFTMFRCDFCPSTMERHS